MALSTRLIKNNLSLRPLKLMATSIRTLHSTTLKDELNPAESYALPNPSYIKYRDTNNMAIRKETDYILKAIPRGLGLLFASQMAGSAIHAVDVYENALGYSKIEVDISTIPVGEIMTVILSGRPIYIFHRSPQDIAESERDDDLPLKHPQRDTERVKRKNLLVVVGVCTHLGCTPVTRAGDFNAFFCPCHGSHFDTAGRIRSGPAASNLEIPRYKFLDENKIVIG